MSEDTESEGLRLLVLDGGDIRTISPLSILEEIIYREQRRREDDTTLLPCDYFHLIGASGPAGIIVVLLAVFRMSIQEAKEEFTKIWFGVFTSEERDPAQRTLKLKALLEDLFTHKGIALDTKFAVDPKHKHRCHGFICVGSPHALEICQKLRTYKGRERTIEVTAYDAIMASCAIPELFLSVHVGPPLQRTELIAAGGGFNNPTREGIKELGEIHHHERDVSCLLSLGCGRPSISGLYNLQNAGPVLLSMMMASQTADELEIQLGETQVFYRFAMDRGHETLNLTSLDCLGLIEAYTSAYRQQPKINREIDNCVGSASGDNRILLREILQATPVKASATLHGLPPICSSFVMRPNLIDLMTISLFDRVNNPDHTMVITGMGGSGKTQIASKFSRVHVNRFSHIFFVDASKEDTIKAGIVSHARSLGSVCKTFDDATEFLKKPTKHSSTPWLLILDNADDRSLELGPFIPVCKHGYTIVTTRNPNHSALSPNAHIEVDLMSEQEAVQALLNAAFGPKSSISMEYLRHARAIPQELGRLPVALVQAGSYIRVNKCLTTYLDILGKNRRRLLRQPARSQLDKHHHAIYIVLDVTRPKLSDQSQRLLNLLSRFNYTRFPVPLLKRALRRNFNFQPYDLLDRMLQLQEPADFLTDIFSNIDNWNILKPEEDLHEIIIAELLAELEEYGLLVRVEIHSVTTLRFHPLVHAWMRDNVTPEEAPVYEEAALRMVCCTAEEDEDLCQFISPHLSFLSPNLDRQHVDDLAGIAILKQWQGDISDAICLWERISTKIEGIRGRNNWRVYLCRALLAMVIENPHEGDWKNHLHEMEYAVRAMTRRWGRTHPDTVKTMAYLGEFKLRYQRIEEDDITRQKNVVSFWHTQPSSTVHIWEIKSRITLSGMYQTQGRIPEAHNTLSVLPQQTSSDYGDDHPIILRLKEQLAGLDSEAPEEALIDVLTRREKVQGPLHLDTIKARTNLAAFYTANARYSKAEEEWKKVVEAWRVRNGPTNPIRLDAMTRLACLHMMQTRYEDGSRLCEKVLVGHRLKGGMHGEASILARKEIVRLYEEFGLRGQAAAVLIEYLKEDDLPTIPPAGEIRNNMKHFSKLYDAKQKYADSAKMFKYLVQKYTRKYGESADITIDAMYYLAKAYHDQHLEEAAITQWSRLLDLYIAHQAPDLDKLYFATYSLMDIHVRQGQLDEAKEQCRRVIIGCKAAAGWDERIMKDMENVANTYKKENLLDEASKLWQFILRMQKERARSSSNPIQATVKYLGWPSTG